jgi:hypothetical protein
MYMLVCVCVFVLVRACVLHDVANKDERDTKTLTISRPVNKSSPVESVKIHVSVNDVFTFWYGLQFVLHTKPKSASLKRVLS